jgi:hypothetical protein
MTDNSSRSGRLGAVIGALIVVVLAFLLLNGGERLGKKTVHGDNDLPPVATGTGSTK